MANGNPAVSIVGKRQQSFSNFYNAPFQVKIKDQLTTSPTIERYFHYQTYTQLYYGNSAKTKKVYTDENKLIDALTRFDQRAKQDNQPAYVPAKIGCGLAGGDWNRIKKHILDNTNITIVELPQRQPEKTITKEPSDELSL